MQKGRDMPVVLEGRKARAGPRSETDGVHVEVLHDSGQPSLGLLVQAHVMARNGQKRTGKSVQSFSALAVLPLQKMSQQALERLERDKISQGVNRLDRMAGEHQCRCRFEDLVPTH